MNAEKWHIVNILNHPYTLLTFGYGVTSAFARLRCSTELKALTTFSLWLCCVFHTVNSKVVSTTECR